MRHALAARRWPRRVGGGQRPIDAWDLPRRASSPRGSLHCRGLSTERPLLDPGGCIEERRPGRRPRGCSHCGSGAAMNSATRFGSRRPGPQNDRRQALDRRPSRRSGPRSPRAAMVGRLHLYRSLMRPECHNCSQSVASWPRSSSFRVRAMPLPSKRGSSHSPSFAHTPSSSPKLASAAGACSASAAGACSASAAGACSASAAGVCSASAAGACSASAAGACSASAVGGSNNFRICAAVSPQH